MYSGFVHTWPKMKSKIMPNISNYFSASFLWVHEKPFTQTIFQCVTILMILLLQALQIPVSQANNGKIFREIDIINEPLHDKSYKMKCAPSEDSYQPGHSHSLIRVFAVRTKEPWVLGYPLSAQRIL